MTGRIGSERSWYLAATFAVSTVRATLMSHVNCVLVGGLIDSERRNKSDEKPEGSRFAT